MSSHLSNRQVAPQEITSIKSYLLKSDLEVYPYANLKLASVQEDII
jgi:hypothetical protein